MCFEKHLKVKQWWHIVSSVIASETHCCKTAEISICLRHSEQSGEPPGRSPSSLSGSPGAQSPESCGMSSWWSYKQPSNHYPQQPLHDAQSKTCGPMQGYLCQLLPVSRDGGSLFHVTHVHNESVLGHGGSQLGLIRQLMLWNNAACGSTRHKLTLCVFNEAEGSEGWSLNRTIWLIKLIT